MIIIKIGGGKQINWDYVAEDIASLIKEGKQLIIIHGASQKRDEIAHKLGIPPKVVVSPSGISSVYTDKKAIEVFLMTYAGLVNKQIVALLIKHGVNAIGLSGVDGQLWQAKRKDALFVKENGKTKLLRGNLTGRVEKVNGNLLQLLISNNYVPVITAPAISFDAEIVNTDNDSAAALVAGSMNVEDIVYLFEARGLLKDFKKEDSVIPQIKKDKLPSVMKYAEGRMKKKLLGVQKAFEQGVKHVYFGDGRIRKPIYSALNRKGTTIE